MPGPPPRFVSWMPLPPSAGIFHVSTGPGTSSHRSRSSVRPWTRKDSIPSSELSWRGAPPPAAITKREHCGLPGGLRRRCSCYPATNTDCARTPGRSTGRHWLPGCRTPTLPASGSIRRECDVPPIRRKHWRAPSFREDVTNLTGGRRTPCGLRSSRQKLFRMVERTNAARCPWLRDRGLRQQRRLPPVNRSGVPPEAEMRQRVWSPARFEEKTTSLAIGSPCQTANPHAVVGQLTGFRPIGDRRQEDILRWDRFESGRTPASGHPERKPHANRRSSRRAEKLVSASLHSRRRRARLRSHPAPPETYCPESMPGQSTTGLDSPPDGGRPASSRRRPAARRSRSSRVGPDVRKNAICRPSGDQAGTASIAGLVVRRSGASGIHKLHVDVVVVLLFTVPGERHLVAIGRKGRGGGYAGIAGKRFDGERRTVAACSVR